MSDLGPGTTGPLTPDLEGLRRLERRIARTMNVRAMSRRVWFSLPAIGQIVAAVLASYAIAIFVLGHPDPILAVTVTITSLGFTRDARPVRVLRSVVGILLGVMIATGIIMLVGQGIWQLGVLLALVMIVARIASTDTTFAVVAATPAAVTLLIPLSGSPPWFRAIDALVGGAVALVMTVLIPRDPRRASLRDGRALYSVLSQAVASVADGLRHGDAGAAELGVGRLARTQPLLDAWSQSLETARSVARLSPFLRPRLPELDRQARALQGADLAVRHLRLVARRCEYLVRGGLRDAVLARLVEQVGQAIDLLGQELEDLLLTGAARSVLLDLAKQLDPLAAVPEGDASRSALVVQLRPLVVDLLVATGMSLPDAQAALRAI
ncbi:MAG TPA: FUSC family protein [Microbacteriaceae bacterium]|nr:FUSC family protein [Microbacteriaceae bacterium]